MEALVDAWERDRTALTSKAIVAGTRGEVARLNELARSRLVAAQVVQDHLGAEIEIVDRDENREMKRFAPGDRVVFTQNERPLGVVNGAVGTVKEVAREGFELRLLVELDDENERGERVVDIPASFGCFDLAYCLTNHKAQGRTFDAAYVLANPAMSDREWTYVAASRSRFATTMFVNASALGLVDPESHQVSGPRKRRADAVEALAKRMQRSRAKGTSLDYKAAGAPQVPVSTEPSLARAVSALLRRIRSKRNALEAAR